DAASGLHVVGFTAGIKNGQGHTGIREDVPRVLCDVTDINDRPALPVGAVWRKRTERVAGHVEGDRRQHSKALLQKQSSGSIVFLHSFEYRKAARRKPWQEFSRSYCCLLKRVQRRPPQRPM